MSKKVLLGMSGGVDSSVSALLLKKQGYEVIGVTMRLWEEKGQEDTNIEDAKAVCNKLGIEHHVVDFKEQFKRNVVDNFICAYNCAKTPNPCIECNKHIKFGAFFKLAEELGTDYVATGHYAKIEYSEKYKQYVLTKSKASTKDQTYFLYGIDKNKLSKIIFPLADFEEKADIRKIAEENDLKVATKKDSQEICFIKNNDYVDFLEKHSKEKEEKQGEIVLTNGEVLGRHNGLKLYTIGQRKGLGISYKEPLYVIKLDKNKNQVIVGVEKELYSKELVANELNFLVNVDLPQEVMAKIRYRAKEAKAVLSLDEGIAKLKFEEPQRAITPGQSVVFYKDNIVIGGGKIITNKFSQNY